MPEFSPRVNPFKLVQATFDLVNIVGSDRVTGSADPALLASQLLEIKKQVLLLKQNGSYLAVMTPARQAQIRKEGDALLYNFNALEKAIQGYKSTSATWLLLHNHLQAFSGDVFAWFVSQELWSPEDIQSELIQLQNTLELVETQLSSTIELPYFEKLVSQFVFFQKRAITKSQNANNTAASENVTAKLFTVAKGLQVLEGFLNKARQNSEAVTNAQKFIRAIESKLFAISEAVSVSSEAAANLTPEVMDRWCALYDAAAADAYSALQAYRTKSASEGNQFFFTLCDEALRELVMLSDTLNSRNLRIQQDSTRILVQKLVDICVAIHNTTVHFVSASTAKNDCLLAVANSFLVSGLELMSFSNFKTVGNPLVLLDVCTLLTIRNIYSTMIVLFMCAPHTFTTTSSQSKIAEALDVCMYHGRPTTLQAMPQVQQQVNQVGTHSLGSLRADAVTPQQILVQNSEHVDELLARILKEESPSVPSKVISDVDDLLGQILNDHPQKPPQIATSDIDDLLAEISHGAAAPPAKQVDVDVVDQLLASIGLVTEAPVQNELLSAPASFDLDVDSMISGLEASLQPKQTGRPSTRAEMMAFFAAETKKKDSQAWEAYTEAEKAKAPEVAPKKVSVPPATIRSTLLAAETSEGAKARAPELVPTKTKPVLPANATEDQYKKYMVDKYEFEQWENAQIRQKLIAEGKL